MTADEPTRRTPPLEFLDSLQRFGIKLGLDTIGHLCRALDHPDRAFSTILVAGTNGKGSVTAFAQAALTHAGYRTGRYTSPHLVRLEERFSLDGVTIAPETLAAVVRRVQDVAFDVRESAAVPSLPTYFEVTTAAALEWFRQARADIAVLEVGLGGRFDATNIVTPAAVAITTIDLDHERHLGATRAAIAFEKAGVIKPAGIVVSGVTDAEAAAVIADACAARGASLIRAHEDVDVAVDTCGDRLRVTLSTPVDRYGPLVLALRGRHQIGNAVVAVRLLEALRARGIAVSRDAIVRGLEHASWPGRLQVVALGDQRRAILDGAHNPAGAAALAAFLREWHPERLPLVFGVMRDKDAHGMLEALAPCVSVVILTQPSGDRAMPLEQVRAAAAPIRTPVEQAQAPVDAIERAFGLAPTICVAGSLFLVGDVLALLGDGPRPPGRAV